MAVAPSFPLRSTFLALPLEDGAKAAFVRRQEALREFGDSLTLQNPDTPHLTLMFWPEVGELEYKGIGEQAAKIASKTAAFGLRVTGPGTFGTRGNDAVLFFEVAFSPELALLKKSCPWTDRRAFHPHITVARVHHPQRFATVKKDVLKLLADAGFTVPCGRLRLYGNVGGRKQMPLQDFPFGG